MDIIHFYEKEGCMRGAEGKGSDETVSDSSEVPNLTIRK
jgi:hypothetical protein